MSIGFGRTMSAPQPFTGQIVGRATRQASSTASSIERGWFWVAATLIPGRYYRVAVVSLRLLASTSDTIAKARLRLTTDGSVPDATSLMLAEEGTAYVPGGQSVPMERYVFPDAAVVTGPQEWHFLLSTVTTAGPGTTQALSDSNHQTQMIIQDVGPFIPANFTALP